MSTPATMYQVDSALIRFVRLVLPVLICGLVVTALYASSTGIQRAAADAPQASPSEQPALPQPSAAPSQAVGDDVRQETALTVLLLLAAANARARREPEAGLPRRLGSQQVLDIGGVQ